MPKVSIVIPVKDCSKTISKSIESVLNQTFEDFEIVVVNNNCSDDTIEKIKSFNDPRIVHFNCDTPGIVPALNTGLYQARANFIARQDGDDVWYPEKLEKQMSLFEEKPETDICGTQIKLVKTTGEVVDDKFRYPINDSIIKSWLLTGRNPIAHPSVVFRKKVLLRVGGYDDTYPVCEDHHFWLRCIKHFNFHNLSEVLVDYNSNHNPNYDAKFPLLASEAQFKVLNYMGIVKYAN